jgi:hypothetical protein
MIEWLIILCTLALARDVIFFKRERRKFTDTTGRDDFSDWRPRPQDAADFDDYAHFEDMGGRVKRE